MSSTKLQYGATLNRINREPLDAETVLCSYTDLIERIEPGEKINRTKKGKFYAGLYTSVVDDENSSYNGPYYISYIKEGTPGNIKISYHHHRLISEDNIDDLFFTCGTIL